MAIPTSCGRIARALVLANVSASLACSSAATPRTDASAPRIELLGADADVWTFRLRVHGALIGAAELTACALELGRAVQPARIDRGRSSAELELEPGVNYVRARCKLRGGRRLQSQRARYDVRLRDAPVAPAQVRSEGGRTLLDARRPRASGHRPAPIVRYAW